MKNKEEILSKLIFELEKNNICYPLALVGSAVSNEIFNDLDLLMAVDDIEVAEKEIRACFSKYELEFIDDAIKIVNFSPVDISIALYSRRDIKDIVEKFLSGEKNICSHRSWSIGYWVAESFVSNLSKMIILRDKNNFYRNIKMNSNKVSPYAKEQILKECIEEIEIKQSLIKKTDKFSLEYSYLKNDIILSLVRGLYVINGKFINGFKEITNLISNCDEELLNRFVVDDDINALDQLLKIFQTNIDWKNILYLGTWQYGGTFKKLSDEEIMSLIKYAKSKGIRKYDTALVYGCGNVERLLAQSLDKNDEILTKIPAKEKPLVGVKKKMNCYYTFEYLKDCVIKSLDNLKREYIDICLLHNWSKDWNNHFELIEWLLELKRENLIKKIGISLPNNYGDTLPSKILSVIDVIEVPLNEENVWILKDIDKYKKYGIEIILRSLFIQGRVLKEKCVNVNDILENVMKHQTSMVIGMTAYNQIDENVGIIRRLK